MPQAEGGQGGESLLDPHHSRANAALVSRAIKNDWPIKPEIKLLVVNEMALIVGRSGEERNRIAAGRVLIAADSVNARREAIWEEAQRPPLAQTNVQINVGALTDGQLEQFCGLIDQVAPGALDGAAPPSGAGALPS